MFRRDPLTGLWKRPPLGLCSLMPGLGMRVPGFGKRPAAGGGGTITGVADLGDLEDTGTTSSSDFAFGSFGTESASRMLLLGCYCRDGAATFSVSSGSIGGVATVNTQLAGQSLTPNIGLLSAMVPTGTSGSANCTWSEGITNDQGGTLLGAYGVSSATPYDSDAMQAGGVSVNSASVTLDCPAGGLVVAGICSASSGLTFTWSLATEMVDTHLADNTVSASMAYETFASAQSGLTVTATFSVSSAGSHVMVAASFSPA